MIMGVDRVRCKKWLAYALICALLVTALPVASDAASIPLTPGTHIRWIDRIGNLPDYAVDFYAWLESNASASGALADPTLAQERLSSL